MADTIRSLADILTLLADNSDGDISAQDVRDFAVSCQFLHPATYTADSSNKAVTLEIGKLTLIDLSSGTLNGNVVVTLPSPGTIGRRCGVQILAGSTVAGSFTGAPGYGAEIANATSINGASYTALSAGTGQWGMWLAGERLVFVDAGTTWLIDVDGRMPAAYRADLTADADGESANTWTAPTAAATPGTLTDIFNIGGLGIAASSTVQPRRKTRYLLCVSGRPKANVADTKYFGLRITDGTNNMVQVRLGTPTTTNQALIIAASAIALLIPGTTYTYQYISQEGGIGLSGLLALSHFEVVEQL